MVIQRTRQSVSDFCQNWSSSKFAKGIRVYVWQGNGRTGSARQVCPACNGPTALLNSPAKPGRLRQLGKESTETDLIWRMLYFACSRSHLESAAKLASNSS